MSSQRAANGAWKASDMPKENLGDFDKVQWCQDLFHDKNVEEVPFQSRTITRNTTLHSLFNRTLATNDTLRATQAFHRKKDDGNMEALLLASIGDGMDGHPGIAHGGTVSTLFDESLSLAALMALEYAFFTASTTITYKAPLPTPGLVLVRSHVKKHDGRKVWINGSMEDGQGKVYATAECLFIMSKDKQASL